MARTATLTRHTFGQAWLGGMAQPSGVPYMHAMTIGTRLFTFFHGRLLGSDPEGNRYFEEKRVRRGARGRRWVMYAGDAEASKVPPEWHAWLHYTTDAPLPLAARKPWQTPHQPNMTGTAGSYRPAGHDYSGGNRAKSTGDYESWTPGS